MSQYVTPLIGLILQYDAYACRYRHIDATTMTLRGGLSMASARLTYKVTLFVCRRLATAAKVTNEFGRLSQQAIV